MKRWIEASLTVAALLSAGAAWAQTEQLQQVEPDKGEIQTEYFGAYGGQDSHDLQAMAGISDHLGLGGDVEIEGGRVDSFGVAALYRFTDPEKSPVGLGLQASASLDRSGAFSEAELRGIVDRRGKSWWLQGDLMLRDQREDGREGANIAYAVSAQRALGEHAWLGIEASGRAARIAGNAEVAPQGEHYAGPSLTLELAHEKLEVGAAFLERLDGEGPRDEPRFYVQFTF